MDSKLVLYSLWEESGVKKESKVKERVLLSSRDLWNEFGHNTFGIYAVLFA